MCEKRAHAVETLGEIAALELERRLADIEACDTAEEFSTLCGNELTRISPHKWLLSLDKGCSIILSCGHSKPRLTTSGATDWPNVRRFRIEEIGNADEH